MCGSQNGPLEGQKFIAQRQAKRRLGYNVAVQVAPRKGKSAETERVTFTFALTIIFADEKKEEKNSFILYTFVKFALVTEQKLNIEEYSISSVNPVPFQA